MIKLHDGNFRNFPTFLRLSLSYHHLDDHRKPIFCWPHNITFSKIVFNRNRFTVAIRRRSLSKRFNTLVCGLSTEIRKCWPQLSSICKIVLAFCLVGENTIQKTDLDIVFLLLPCFLCIENGNLYPADIDPSLTYLFTYYVEIFQPI